LLANDDEEEDLKHEVLALQEQLQQRQKVMFWHSGCQICQETHH
jgi:hypothetical protein